MKKIFRLMRAVLMAGVLTCASMSAIQAENDVKEKVTGYYMSYDENCNLVSQNMPDFSGMRSDNHTEVTLVKSGHDSSRDCGYHPDTNVWRKVNQYHFNTSNTVNITLGLDEEYKEYFYYNPAGTAIPSVTKETGQYEMTDPDTIRFLSGDLVNTVAVLDKNDLFLVTDQKKVFHLLKKDHTYTAY